MSKWRRIRQVGRVNALARRLHVIGIVADQVQVNALRAPFDQLFEFGRFARQPAVKGAVELTRVDIGQIVLNLVLRKKLATGLRSGHHLVPPHKANGHVAVFRVIRRLELVALRNLVFQSCHARLFIDGTRSQHVDGAARARFGAKILDRQRCLARHALFFPTLAGQLMDIFNILPIRQTYIQEK